ncbi:MAG: YfhO family protein [Chloroflexi bacterium]|nr:YfhO family protein [Chloroflexota bacterium]
MPFLANVQTAVFYPTTWLAIVLDPPAAFKAGLLFHAGMALAGTFLFARRSLALGVAGAAAAAIAFAFGGFLTAQAGHPNQVAAAVWLPWLLLLIDGTGRRPPTVAPRLAPGALDDPPLGGKRTEVRTTNRRPWLTLLVRSAHFSASFPRALLARLAYLARASSEPPAEHGDSPSVMLSRSEPADSPSVLLSRSEPADSPSVLLSRSEPGDSPSVTLSRSEPGDSPSVMLSRSEASPRREQGGPGRCFAAAQHDDPGGSQSATDLADGRVLGVCPPVGTLAAGAVVVAFQVFAGHTQELYLSLLAAGVYALGRPPRLRRAAGLAAMVALGLGLAAVQLVPALELSALSIRSGGLSGREAVSFSLPPWRLPDALLPNYAQAPFAEFSASVGLVGSALAVVALARAPVRQVAVWALLAIGALCLALGGFTPVYWLALKLLPGLSYFRVPARFLFLYGFAAAILVGIGLDALARTTNRATTGLLVSSFWFLARRTSTPYSNQKPKTKNQKPVTPNQKPVGAAVRWLVLALLAGDLFAAGRPQPIFALTLPEAYSAWTPSVAFLDRAVGGARALGVSTAIYEPGDAGEVRRMLADVLPPAAIRDYLVARKYKDILAPNLSRRFGIPTLDGYDGGLLPLRAYVEWKQALLRSAGVRPRPDGRVDRDQADGLLREQLAGIPDADLLGRAGVAYVVADRTDDLWRDGAYFELGTPVVIDPGETITVAVPVPQPATWIGVVVAVAGSPDRPAGAGGLVVTALGEGAPAVERMLTAGQGLAVVPPGRLSPAERQIGRVDLPADLAVQTIHLRSAATGPIVVEGLTLADARTGASTALDVNPAWELVYLGDVKIKRNRRALPRAYAIQEGTATDSPLPPGGRGAGVEGAVRIVLDAPEHIVLEAELPTAGLVVLADTAYPGWRATLDGSPVEIQRVDGLFRGIRVPAGQHRVEMVFRPVSLAVGAAASASAILALAALIAFGATGSRWSRGRLR